MERLATLFTGSFRQLKQVKTVTVCAMLGAIAIVLGSLSIGAWKYPSHWFFRHSQ